MVWTPETTVHARHGRQAVSGEQAGRLNWIAAQIGVEAEELRWTGMTDAAAIRGPMGLESPKPRKTRPTSPASRAERCICDTYTAGAGDTDEAHHPICGRALATQAPGRQQF